MIQVSAPNSAIHFESEAFSFQKSIMGRQSAGRGFLRGFCEHSAVETLYCYCKSSQDFADFSNQVLSAADCDRRARWIPFGRDDVLAEPGCLFRPDPAIGESAWRRRSGDARAYSLCGITNTICSKGVMDAIGDLMLAPVQRWDALICTSRAAKKVILESLEEWRAYLSSRLGGQPYAPVEMPIIPMGVDCRAYANTKSKRAKGRALRTRLGIGANEIAVLFAGRLSFHSKSHPVPMYIALEQAALRTGVKTHLVLAGSFSSALIREEFTAAARRYCPSVRLHLIDGRTADFGSIWHGVDLFTCLSDNIQETFGLTPIEAMAAGLPLVVSDWNGYRDTVRHGLDGFRIATAMPQAGTGAELAERYLCGQDSYDRHIGYAALSTAVDISQAADAYATLIANPELRCRFGAAARQRAREVFDWSVIIRRYQDLWCELADRRENAEEIGQQSPSSPRHPLRRDPFAAFGCYSTASLTPESLIRMTVPTAMKWVRELIDSPIAGFGNSVLSPEDDCEAMLASLKQGPQQVVHVLNHVADERRATALRTLGWLAKFGVIRVEGLYVAPDGSSSFGDGLARH